MPRTITVRGTGKISAKPDQISVSLTVEAKDPDYAAAMEKADRDADAISRAVREAGIEDDALRMANFNVRADYESVHDEHGNWTRHDYYQGDEHYYATRKIEYYK